MKIIIKSLALEASASDAEIIQSLNQALWQYNSSHAGPKCTFIEAGISADDPRKVIIQLISWGRAKTSEIALSEIRDILQG